MKTLHTSSLFLLMIAVGWVMAACGDQVPTPLDDDDIDGDDDTGPDDDDADDGVTPEDVQNSLNNLTSWGNKGGCSRVVLWGTDAAAEVELNFSASLDFGEISFPYNRQYDLSVPGSGGVLSVKAGSGLGTTACTANPGNPEVTDNYSVEAGTVTLDVTRNGSDYNASVTFSNIELLRVGGNETVTIPNGAMLGPVGVGEDP